MSNETDQRIIEAATLMLRLQHLEEGEECDRVGRALDAALAPLSSEAGALMAAMMVAKLLDGKPYGVTSGNPDSIRRCIAVAHRIGATVEDSDGDPVFGQLGLRSIKINPPSQAKQ